eukprot:NODE_216_length_14242_cov_0.417592.p11 type:complete len:100 gc:universal NODE_216_length_14242_cov_0.417592:3673-3374(-)
MQQQTDASKLSNSSRTQTIAAQETDVTLRIQPTVNPTERRVQFAEGVVNNENMNKKKSKVCCIYRKPHNCDETDSDSDISEDDQNLNGYERKPKYKHQH